MDKAMSLSDTTFIIPIRIDSSDRLRNIKLISDFLLKNFDSKIIIKESDSAQKLGFFKNYDSKLTYIYEKNDNIFFHKTRLLNDMIIMSDTNCIVQYDSDIILPINSYFIAEAMVLNGFDAVYPFIHGHNSSKRVHINDESLKKFYENFDFGILDQCSEPWDSSNFYGYSHFGFCTFYNRDSYFKGFLENEEFYSGGPEDQEIYYRFINLGLNVGRVNDVIYHIEHYRGNFSLQDNEHYFNNINLFNRLTTLPKEDLINYYSNTEYYKNRIKDYKK